MDLSSRTENVGLKINKVTREIYDYLRSSGRINENELYCVDNEYLDAEGKRVINVANPISSTDGVNLGTLSQVSSSLRTSIDVNSTDIRDRYAKSETYSNLQVNGLLRDLSSAYYTKGEVDGIISSSDVYRIRKNPSTQGDIYLYNSCTNVVELCGNANFILPQKLPGEELTRSFSIVMNGDISAYDLQFLGYGAEYVKFRGFDSNSQLTSSGTYVLFFDEILSSVFQTAVKKLTDNFLSSEEQEYSETSVYLMNGKINAYTLTSNTNFIFPPCASDDLSIRIPREFEIYIKQSALSSYSVEFSGFDGESIYLKTNDGDFISEMNLSGEYAYFITELSDCGNIFYLTQRKTKEVDL